MEPVRARKWRPLAVRRTLPKGILLHSGKRFKNQKSQVGLELVWRSALSMGPCPPAVLFSVGADHVYRFQIQFRSHTPRLHVLDHTKSRSIAYLPGRFMGEVLTPSKVANVFLDILRETSHALLVGRSPKVLRPRSARSRVRQGPLRHRR